MLYNLPTYFFGEMGRTPLAPDSQTINQTESMVRRLQATKFVRAVGQGALYVLFTLYLKELGWSPTALGLLFSVGGLLTASIGWFVGIACDRMGRKRFLLVYEALTVAAGVLLTFTQNEYALALASLLLGFGRGQTGIPGPMAAAEQAWLAEGVPAARRGSVFSANSALGFFGTGIGAIIAASVPWLEGLLPGLLVYRPFFLLTAVGAAWSYWALAGAHEAYRFAKGRTGRSLAGQGHERGDSRVERIGQDPRDVSEFHKRHEEVEDADPNAADAADAIRRQENGIMIRMALINALNGVAIGLTGPLLVYWFNLKFGVGPGSLGPVFALTYIATGLASVWTGRLTERIGIVKAVVTVRMAAVVLLVLVPMMPNFALAATLHVLRSALGRGSVGARRALAVNLVRDERRGFASSVNNISMQFPQAVGPSIAGAFIAAGQMAMPFYLGAVMQFLYGTFYGAAFQRYDTTPPKAKTADASRGGLMSSR